MCVYEGERGARVRGGPLGSTCAWKLVCVCRGGGFNVYMQSHGYTSSLVVRWIPPLCEWVCGFTYVWRSVCHRRPSLLYRMALYMLLHVQTHIYIFLCVYVHTYQFATELFVLVLLFLSHSLSLTHTHTPSLSLSLCLWMFVSLSRVLFLAVLPPHSFYLPRCLSFALFIDLTLFLSLSLSLIWFVIDRCCHKCIHIYTCTYTYIYISICVYKYSCTQMYICVHTYIYIYIHIYTYQSCVELVIFEPVSPLYFITRSPGCACILLWGNWYMHYSYIYKFMYICIYMLVYIYGFPGVWVSYDGIIRVYMYTLFTIICTYVYIYKFQICI